MIVVDANIIAYLLIRGEHSESVDELQKSDEVWIAPGLWLDEFLNILCTYERNKQLTAQQSVSILQDALILMDGNSYDLPPERVLSVARRTGCSAYDSQYIALAEDLGTMLYTFDKRILRACKELATRPN